MSYNLELKCYKHFCNFDNKIIYDIGANEGEITNFFLENSNNSTIYVEPHPNNFKILSEKFNNLNVKLINSAVGESNGECEIGLEKQERTGGIMQAHILLNKDTDLQKRVYEKKDKVSSIMLSDLCSDANIIKMDIEGFEHKVIYNQIDKIKNLDTILLEIHSWDDLELHGWNFEESDIKKDSLNKMINYFINIGFNKFIPVKKVIKINKDINWNMIELSSYSDNGIKKYYKVLNLIIQKNSK